MTNSGVVTVDPPGIASGHVASYCIREDPTRNPRAVTGKAKGQGEEGNRHKHTHPGTGLACTSYRENTAPFEYKFRAVLSWHRRPKLRRCVFNIKLSESFIPPSGVCLPAAYL